MNKTFLFNLFRHLFLNKKVLFNLFKTSTVKHKLLKIKIFRLTKVNKTNLFTLFNEQFEERRIYI